MKNKQSIILLLVLLFVLVGASGPMLLTQLTKQQLAGKDVYSKGMGMTDVKITAQMSGVSVPATVMACVNCHNADGSGNPEGGITPSNITWKELTKNYGGNLQNQRKRPAYTERSLRNAISSGIDPAGNELHNAMPRYVMSREDMDNLISYLKVIGDENDVGISNSTIKIGVSLPQNNKAPQGKNEALIKLVNAYVSNLNESGGLYHRKIEPYFFTNASEMEAEEYFMVLGEGYDYVERKINQSQTPGLLSHSSALTKQGLQNPYGFYMYPSLIIQSTALIDYAKSEGFLTKDTSIFIAHEESSLVQGIVEYCKEQYSIEPTVIQLQKNNIAAIGAHPKIGNNDLILYLGGQQLGNPLLQHFQENEKSPYILVPGTIASINLFETPANIRNNVFFGYPTWPSERTSKGKEMYQTLKSNYALSENWKGSQWEMLAQLTTVEEILKRGGKKLYKDKIKEGFEGLFRYYNGLSPALSYDLNRRVGSSLMYIIGLNEKGNGIQMITAFNTSER
ncbi:MAG: ABC transporter substrate-binding protein [Aureisphaera sp.]